MLAEMLAAGLNANVGGSLPLEGGEKKARALGTLALSVLAQADLTYQEW
jgi:hypothetical protein